MIRTASLFLVVTSLIFWLPVRSDDDAPRVKTILGNIKGYHKISEYGRLYEAYEGVPYALPPIGKLRFKRLRAMKEVAGNLAHLGSMVTKETFTRGLQLLKTIEDAWRQNVEVELDGGLISTNNFSNLSLNDEESNHDNIDPSNIVMPHAIKLRGKPKDIFKSTISKSKK